MCIRDRTSRVTPAWDMFQKEQKFLHMPQGLLHRAQSSCYAAFCSHKSKNVAVESARWISGRMTVWIFVSPLMVKALVFLSAATILLHSGHLVICMAGSFIINMWGIMPYFLGKKKAILNHRLTFGIFPRNNFISIRMVSL